MNSLPHSNCSPRISLKGKLNRSGGLLAIGLGLAALPLAEVQGAQFSWAGTTNGLWDTSTNWVGGSLPAFDGTEDILVPASGVVTTTGTITSLHDIKSIEFKGTGFSLNGAGPLKIENGLTSSSATTATNNFNAPIQLGGNNLWNVASNNTITTLGINTAGFVFATTGPGQVKVQDVISGAGSLNINQSTFRMSSSSVGANLTSVAIAGNGSLVLDNTGTNLTNRLNDAAPITVSGGTIELQGKASAATTETLGALTVSQGTASVLVTPGTSTSTGLTFASFARNPGGVAKFADYTASRLGVVDFIKFTSAPTLTNGIIAGAVVNDGNTFSELAGYDATKGVVTATYQSSTVGGSALVTDNVKITANETLAADKTINGLVLATNTGYNNGLNLGGKTLTVTSGMVLLARSNECVDNGTIAFGSTEGVFFGYSQGRVSQGGGLTVTGNAGVTFAGSLFWGGRAGWTGTSTIAGGLYVLNNSNNSFTDNSALVITAGGSLQLAGNVTKSETVGSLAGSGLINISQAAGYTYTLVAGGDNTSTEFSGAMNGGFNLTKNGSGTFTYSGTGNNTGTVTVNAGKMSVNGTLSNGTTVVSSGGTLGGSGKLGVVNVVSGGSLAPGNSIGTISTGNLTLATGSVLDVELGRNGTSVTNDLTNVTGTVDLSGGPNLKLTLYTGLTAPEAGDIFYLIVNDSTDAINGFFTSLNGTATTLSEGSQFTWNSQQWEITYQANSEATTPSFTGGNDVAIMAVPEPATWSMIVGGMGLMAFLQRARRRMSL